jgi:glycyl-tRNA synthetase beta chain
MMGDYYGREEGLPADVCTGIRETYSPRQAGAPVAKTLTGAIAGIADKVDTITALFALGRIPTGAADPFALRRAANGIMRTLYEHHQTMALEPVVRAAIACVRETETRLGTTPKTTDNDALCAQILDFMKTRLRFMLLENHAAEVVDSVLAVSELADVPAIIGRVETLSRHRKSEMFESLATTFKRVANIVRQANVQTGNVDEKLFEDKSENTFYNAITSVSAAYRDAMVAKDFDSALSKLETLRAPADAFFDAVLVNAENDAVRLNRLALLSSVQGLFDVFCDVRKL